MSADKKPLQNYRGNGKHDWETVVDRSPNSTQDTVENGHVERLRVPGGWLYNVVNDGDQSPNTVFVPMPAVVDYAI